MNNTYKHIQALFISALYYWIIDDELAAQTCLEVAAQVSQLTGGFIGEA